LVIALAPMWAVTFVLIETRPVDWWSFTAGLIGASAGATLVFVRDDAPKHVLNWLRGAEGERKTEKTLRSLEKLGWLVEHDLQRSGGANLDHVVTGPPGVFVLETKNLEGTITIEDSVLTARQLDDPDQVYQYRGLAPRLRGQAKELSAQRRTETGRGPWVNAVVVIWGQFPDGRVENENVTYIDGEHLVSWLMSRPPRPQRIPE
jgi:hypothetical protein